MVFFARASVNIARVDGRASRGHVCDLEPAVPPGGDGVVPRAVRVLEQDMRGPAGSAVHEHLAGECRVAGAHARVNPRFLTFRDRDGVGVAARKSVFRVPPVGAELVSSRGDMFHDELALRVGDRTEAEPVPFRTKVDPYALADGRHAVV